MALFKKKLQNIHDKPIFHLLHQFSIMKINLGITRVNITVYNTYGIKLH